MKKLITALFLLALAAPVFAQEPEAVQAPEQAPAAQESQVAQEPAAPEFQAIELDVAPIAPKPERWTVRGSVGYFPSVPVLVSLFGAIFVGIAISANKDANETLDIELPPYFAVDAFYNFNDQWSVGLSTGYTGCVWKVIDKDTRAVHSTSYMTFIPLNIVGRCNYLSRPAVKLYGSLEAGGLFSFGGDFSAAPNVQINPIGIEFGRKLFGMVELGIGMNYTGGRIGLGYRF